jgi:hypothetical protein
MWFVSIIATSENCPYKREARCIIRGKRHSILCSIEECPAIKEFKNNSKIKCMSSGMGDVRHNENVKLIYLDEFNGEKIPNQKDNWISGEPLDEPTSI